MTSVSKVTGPIEGGNHGWLYGAYFGDISKLGYIEEEYFLEGVAAHYVLPEGIDYPDVYSLDGKWDSISKGAYDSPYKTRIVVQRPADPLKFNGTVILEMTNATTLTDLLMAYRSSVYEAGFAIVYVTLQATVLNSPDGLKNWDSVRYGSLTIEDDYVLFDIFTQAARTIDPNRDKAKDPMGGLDVKKIIATGQSQSGRHLTAYYNVVQPIENAIDGFVPIISGAQLSCFDAASFAWLEAVSRPLLKGGKDGIFIGARARDDITAPMFQLLSESETRMYWGKEQPDSDTFRIWQVAGASHGYRAQAVNWNHRKMREGIVTAISDIVQYNSCSVSWGIVLDAILVHMNDWLCDGIAPPESKLITLDDVGFVVRDEHGNALGGVRLPEVEVPVATFACGFGTRTNWTSMPMITMVGLEIPFSSEKLKSLYPTNNDYVDKVTAATNKAVAEGVILPSAARNYIVAAKAAPIPELVIIS